MSNAQSKLDCLVGPAAIPRSNGEILFDAPWEARVFGAAVGLHEAGHYDWSVFQQALIDAIRSGDPELPYYQAWMGALENVMLEQSLVTEDEVRARTSDFLEGRRVEVY